MLEVTRWNEEQAAPNITSCDEGESARERGKKSKAETERGERHTGGRSLYVFSLLIIGSVCVLTSAMSFSREMRAA